MFTPLSRQQWNYETAAHLLNRAGFGGTPAEIEAAYGKGLQVTVHDLVDSSDDFANVPPPAWAHPRKIGKIRTEMRSKRISPKERKERKREFHGMEGENILDLRRWWLERMLTSPAPLLEKMTLFWHGHFATSVQKVKDGYWMWLQNDTLRRNALGNFATLTKKMSRDPAMMIYLDLQKSQRGTPKRELGARVDGTLHGRDRQLHRAGHSRISARVYWLSCRPEDAAISVCAFPARRELENVHGPKPGRWTATTSSTR